jgi:hypothetical protein
LLTLVAGRIVSALTTIANVSRRSPYSSLPDEVGEFVSYSKIIENCAV